MDARRGPSPLAVPLAATMMLAILSTPSLRLIYDHIPANLYVHRIGASNLYANDLPRLQYTRPHPHRRPSRHPLGRFTEDAIHR